MANLLDKISSYNIFNYLLPGTLFVVIGDHLTGYNLLQDDLLVALFLYYFIGLVISRLGSLIIEPALKRIRVVILAQYGDYIMASSVDDKIDVLSEVNNMYRTLCALFVALLGTIGYERLEERILGLTALTPYLLMIGLLVLFLAAYRKQAGYIVQRVRAHTGEDDTATTPPDPPGRPTA